MDNHLIVENVKFTDNYSKSSHYKTIFKEQHFKLTNINKMENLKSAKREGNTMLFKKENLIYYKRQVN